MAVKKELHSTEEIKTVFDELSKQTDRGAGIIAAAVVEELLAVVIQARLTPQKTQMRVRLDPSFWFIKAKSSATLILATK